MSYIGLTKIKINFSSQFPPVSNFYIIQLAVSEIDVEKTATMVLICALCAKNMLRNNILHKHSNNYAQLIIMTLTYLQLQKNKLKFPCIKKINI